MIHVEIHETIQRPIEQVFERLVDIPAYSDWMPGNSLFISGTQESRGPVDVGTRYTDVTRLGKVRGEVSAFERPVRVVFHYTARLFGRTVLEGWPGYLLERDGAGGTRVHHVGEAKLYGPSRLLQPLVGVLARRERRLTVDALKRSLEREANRDTGIRLRPDS